MSALDSDADSALAKKRRKVPSRQHFFELDRIAVSVHLGSYRADALYWGVLGQRPWRNYLHAHSFFEVCYATHGTGRFQMLSRTHRVSQGQLFIARPGQMHEIVSSRRRPLAIHFWAFTLLHAKQAQNGSDADRATDGLVESFLRSTRQIVALPLAVPQTLNLLTQEVAARAPGYTLAINSLTRKLLLDTLRALADGPTAAEPVEAPARNDAEIIIRTATRYLRDNLARPLEIRDVAAQVHLSERHLSRLFRTVTGVTVLDYLTSLRVEEASQLLLDPTLPIKQVARSVGYPDTHYFTTLFGRRTGLTPAAFRRARGTKFLNRQPET